MAAVWQPAHASEPANCFAVGWADGFKAEPFEAERFQIMLVLDHDLLHFGRVFEPRVERHFLIAERRLAVFVEADDDHVHPLVANFDQAGLRALDQSAAAWAVPRRRPR